MVFLIGLSSEDQNFFPSKELEKEITQFGDILRLDFDERKMIRKLIQAVQRLNATIALQLNSIQKKIMEWRNIFGVQT